MNLNDIFTSTGHKFFAHQEAMNNLRNGKGHPIVTHVMLTDVCNHTCAFCSVQARAGDSLHFDDVMNYLDTLIRFGLKAVILSGGGNPILYKCKKTGNNFNDVVDAIHHRGLEIGLITNGMATKTYLEFDPGCCDCTFSGGPGRPRQSWSTVSPRTLDKITWIRISMSGLDHHEKEVFVPDIDPRKTTLGFSYVAHDIYVEPFDLYHGKVSTSLDLISGDKTRKAEYPFEDRISELTKEFCSYAKAYRPKYIRLLPNCLEPGKIPLRVTQLEAIAKIVNFDIDEEIVFVQNKPPAAPKACFLGYIHPVLNCDGYVYPCDSCVLNETAKHQFANPWRICHLSEIASLYEKPVRSLIANPGVTCPGCVFTRSNAILKGVIDGVHDFAPPKEMPEHHIFV